MSRPPVVSGNAGFARRLLVLAALVLTAALAAPAAASADNDGTIQGTVTRATGGTPVQNVTVGVYQGNSFIASGQTGVEGTYSITGLAYGSYRVYFSAPSDLRSEAWNGKTFQDADAVVLDAETSSRTLSPALHQQITVSGHVTIDGADVPSGDVCVTVLKADLDGFGGQVPVTGGSVGAGGLYSVTNLAAGDYKVQFDACSTTSYKTQFNGGASTFAAAPRITMAEGNTATVDAAMHHGGKISGTVSSGGNPVAANSVCVSVFQADLGPAGPGGIPGQQVYVGDTPVGANGTYQVIGLDPGDYKVQFQPCLGSNANYISQYNGGGSSFSGAPRITLTQDQILTNVHADMVAGAKITGHIVADGAPGTGLGSICVGVYAGAQPSGFPIAFGQTDSSGDYTVSGLAAGTYSLGFSSCGGGNYISEYYDDAASSSAPTFTTVTLAAGATATANASLAPGASISGKVSQTGGAGLSNVCVSANSASGGGSTFTDGSGNYTLSGLRAGTYQLTFTNCGPGSWSPGGLSVTVTTGEAKTGQNVTLTAAATITGRVTDAANTGLGSVFVSAYVKGQESGGSVTSAMTNSDGVYNLTGLSAGDYTVRFSDAGGRGLAAVYYDQKPDARSATTVTLASGATASDVNAKLKLPGKISGTVSGPSEPVAGACVAVFSNAATGAATDLFNPVTIEEADANGAYTIAGLTEGSYKLRFSDCDPTGTALASEYYNDKATLGAASSVAVVSNQTTANVNATLALGGVISGTATSTTGKPAEGVCVAVIDQTGNLIDGGLTEEDGTYVIVGLPAASYKVEFVTTDCAFASRSYATQWASGKASFAGADLIAVTGGATHSGVNATLTSTGATLSGHVAAPAPDSASLGGICVTAYDPASFFSENVRSAGTKTNASGDYSMEAVPPGTYRVEFRDCNTVVNYAPEWYDDKPDPFAAQDVVLAAGDTKTADAVLAVGGRISGTVTDSQTGAAIAGICVETFSPAYASTETDALGNYTLTGLTAGDYWLNFYDCTLSHHYPNDRYYHNTSNPTDVTLVHVTAGNEASGIDELMVSDIDSTPPDTVIDAQPTAISGATSPLFTFHSTETNSTFQCKLDSGAYEACTSPKGYTALADGSHTFSVKATDSSNNTDTSAATYTWTVDTIAPTATLGTKPASVTNATTASFALGSNQSGSTFQCKLDAGSYAACTSPKALTGLTEGSHTFSVLATDVAGNEQASPTVHTWTVDLTAPTATLGNKPAAMTNATTASFALGSNENGSTFRCKLDSGSFATCTDPNALTGLGNGSHTFSVLATDVAGNEQATATSYTWTVDIVAPNTSITGTKPALRTPATSATFTYDSTEANSTFECKLDGATFSSCLVAGVSYASLADGSHTFSVRATDGVGNVDGSPEAYTWTVDTTAPTAKVLSGPSGTTSSHEASFLFSSTETGSTFDCKLDGAGSWTTCPPKFENLAAGSHTVLARAVDDLGNKVTTDNDPKVASRQWTVADTATTETSEGTATSGQTVTSDPAGTGPTAAKPVVVDVKVPVGGDVTITTSSTQSQSSTQTGWVIFGGSHEIIITAPPGSDAAPLELTFSIDKSEIPSGTALSDVTVFRDGVPAADCLGATTTTNGAACVKERVDQGTSIKLTILTPHASAWNFGKKPAPVVTPPADPPADTTPPVTPPADHSADTSTPVTPVKPVTPVTPVTHVTPVTPVTPTKPVAHCVVPKLKGKTLAAAKKVLTTAKCALGKVTKKKGAKKLRGKVVKQTPAPGKVLAVGSKVAVVIGK